MLEDPFIQYYVIHCVEHEERNDYLNEIKLKLNKEIEIFKGIFTKHVDLNRQTEYIHHFDKSITFDEKYNFHFYLSGQIGCYLSHHKLIEKIMYEKNTNDKCVGNYSVIFEDDVSFETNLDEKIKVIIHDLHNHAIDFDIIFLGNLKKNKGINVTNNIYFIDKSSDLWGTHALLINNKNIEKIYKINCNIKYEIDNHYKKSIIENELIGFTIYPPICDQNPNFRTTIAI